MSICASLFTKCNTNIFALQVVGLYKKLGFVDDPEGIRGMAFQRKRKDKKGMGLF
jgi:hypothetical protein